MRDEADGGSPGCWVSLQPLTRLLKLAFPSRAKDMKNRLGIFRRRNESPGANPSGKLDKVLKSLK